MTQVGTVSIHKSSWSTNRPQIRKREKSIQWYLAKDKTQQYTGLLRKQQRRHYPRRLIHAPTVQQRGKRLRNLAQL